MDDITYIKEIINNMNNNILRIEDKVDKTHSRLFEDNGEPSICSMVKDHEKKLNERNVWNIIKTVGIITGSLTTTGAFLSGIYIILTRVIK
jgi:hypothetical protein